MSDNSIAENLQETPKQNDSYRAGEMAGSITIWVILVVLGVVIATFLYRKFRKKKHDDTRI